MKMFLRVGVLVILMAPAFASSEPHPKKPPTGQPIPAAPVEQLRDRSGLLVAIKAVEADTATLSDGLARIPDIEKIRQTLSAQDPQFFRLRHADANGPRFAFPYIYRAPDFRWLGLDKKLPESEALVELANRDPTTKKFPASIYLDPRPDITQENAPAPPHPRLDAKDNDVALQDPNRLIASFRSIVWDETSVPTLHQHVSAFEQYARQIKTDVTRLGSLLTHDQTNPLNSALLTDAELKNHAFAEGDGLAVPEILAVVKQWNALVSGFGPIKGDKLSARITALDAAFAGLISSLKALGPSRVTGLPSLDLTVEEGQIKHELETSMRLALAIEQAESRWNACNAALESCLTNQLRDFGAFAAGQHPPSGRTWQEILNERRSDILIEVQKLAYLKSVLRPLSTDLELRARMGKSVLIANRSLLLNWISYVLQVRSGIAMFDWEAKKNGGVRVAVPSQAPDSFFRNALSSPAPVSYTVVDLVPEHSLDKDAEPLSPNEIVEYLERLPQGDRNKPLVILAGKILLSGSWAVGPTYVKSSANGPPVFRSILIISLENVLAPNLSIRCNPNAVFESASFAMPGIQNQPDENGFIRSLTSLPTFLTVSHPPSPAGNRNGRIHFLTDGPLLSVEANVLGGDVVATPVESLVDWLAGRGFRNEYRQFYKSLNDRYLSDASTLDEKGADDHEKPSKLALTLLRLQLPIDNAAEFKSTRDSAMGILHAPRLLSVPGSEGSVPVIQRGVLNNSPVVVAIPNFFTLEAGDGLLGEARITGDETSYSSRQFKITFPAVAPFSEALNTTLARSLVKYSKETASENLPTLKVDMNKIGEAIQRFASHGYQLNCDQNDCKLEFKTNEPEFGERLRVLFIGHQDLRIPIEISFPNGDPSERKSVDIPFSLRRAMPSDPQMINDLLGKGKLVLNERGDVYTRSNLIITEDLDWGKDSNRTAYVIDLGPLDNLTVPSPDNLALPIDMLLTTVRTEKTENGQKWEKCPPMLEPISVRDLRTRAESRTSNSEKYNFVAPTRRMRVVLDFKSYANGTSRLEATTTFECNDGVCQFDKVSQNISEALQSVPR
jgi:hypothetical protein